MRFLQEIPAFKKFSSDDPKIFIFSTLSQFNYPSFKCWKNDFRASRGTKLSKFSGDPKHPNPPAVSSLAALSRTTAPVSYTHLRAHETVLDLVCRLLLEKKKKIV